MESTLQSTLADLSEPMIAFAILAAVFVPLERAFPARRQPILRLEWWSDVLFFLGQYLVWSAPVIAVLVAVHAWLRALPLEGVWGFVRGQPMWLQFLGAIALSDLAIYWGHRFSHSNAFLWRFHRVHHTSVRLDWLAAHREHPIDSLYTRLIENLPPILLGFPLPALAGFAVFRGLWALYIHSNVRLSPGPLRYLLGAPRLHHWHHEPRVGGRVNFANLSPLMDLLFGTFHDPRTMPERYGSDERVPHGFFAQMVAPFRRPTSVGTSVRAEREPRDPAGLERV